MRSKLLNLVAFQLAWFACVLGAARGVPWVGPLVVCVFIAWHLSSVGAPRREATLLLGVALLGTVLDTMQARAGVFAFSAAGGYAGFTPPWLIALWLAFAATLTGSLSWLAGRYWSAALCGALAGPLSYYAGHQLGALYLPPDRAWSLIVLALVWGTLLPALLWVAGRTHER